MALEELNGTKWDRAVLLVHLVIQKAGRVVWRELK